MVDDIEGLARKEPQYLFPCKVLHVVDGDTLDVTMDLGFEIRNTDRMRLRGVDTAEIHGVSHDSSEFDRGQEHKHTAARWIAKGKNEDIEFPFVLYSQEYDRGGFGRIIGDLWSPHHEQWLTDFLVAEFDDIEYE